MSQYEENFESIDQKWRSGDSLVDRAKRTTSEKLRQAAQALHQRSESSSGQVNKPSTELELGKYGHQAADWLDRTADYVSDVNPAQVKADLTKQIQQNPGRTLLIAGGVGLILGAILKRK
jgi:ElaB/YqjD/DUF883 family membrane-anchored ribosome-binding protein